MCTFNTSEISQHSEASYLLELVKDSARQFPYCCFKVATKDFGLSRQFKKVYPSVDIKKVIKKVGGKSRLKDVFNSECILFR